MASHNDRVEQQLTLASSFSTGGMEGGVAAAVSAGNVSAVPRLSADDVLSRILAGGATAIAAELIEWETLYTGGTPAAATTDAANVQIDLCRRLAPVLTGEMRNFAATLVSTGAALTYAITALRLAAPTGTISATPPSIDNAIPVWDGLTATLLKTPTNGPQVNAGGDLIVDPASAAGSALRFGPGSGGVFTYNSAAGGSFVGTVSGTMALISTGIATIGSAARSVKLTDGTNAMFLAAGVASGVNQLTATNAATGNSPSLSSTGTDADLDLLLVSKGAGLVKANGSEVATALKKLSFFAATTSLELKGVISDETGSGALVFADTPTILTPTIASFINANHTHLNAAGGGVLTAAAISDFTEAAQDAALGALVFLDTTDVDVTYNDGAGTFSLVVTTKLKTVVRMIYIENPTAADEYPIGAVPDAATMVRVVGATDAGTVTFNVEKRSMTTPYTAGTDIFTSDQVAGTGGSVLNTTTFNSGAISADSWLHYSASAVASSPTKLWVWVEYTID